jgi:hypothetical protein
MKLLQAGLAVTCFLALDSPHFQHPAQKTPHKPGVIDNQCSHGYLLAEPNP